MSFWIFQPFHLIWIIKNNDDTTLDINMFIDILQSHTEISDITYCSQSNYGEEGTEIFDA